MKALREVGVGRLARYGAWSSFSALLRAAPTPPLRAALLRAAGARIGRGSVIGPGLRLENLDRGRGAAALQIGRDCWIAPDVHFDLADEVVLGDSVSVGSRSVFNTHLNVGYADHPLHEHMPPRTGSVVVGPGSFVGVGAILLAGTRLGPETFVAAGSVVGGEHEGGVLLGGAPARVLRRWADS